MYATSNIKVVWCGRFITFATTEFYLQVRMLRRLSFVLQDTTAPEARLILAPEDTTVRLERATL